MAVGSLRTHDALAHEHVKDDILAPARGIVIGLVLSAFLWAIIAFLVMQL